ncbi:hypothetical protein ACLB2K_062859 [Fragaria x ananassa]
MILCYCRYKYRLPPGKSNDTCGGANRWADVGTGSVIFWGLFCPVGSYCPTTVKKLLAVEDTTARWVLPLRNSALKFKLTSCDQRNPSQKSYSYGIMHIAALCTLLLLVYNFSYQVLTTRNRSMAKSREVAAKMQDSHATSKKFIF